MPLVVGPFDLPRILDVHEVPRDEDVELFRIVRTGVKGSDALFESFVSNFASGKRPRRVERRSAVVHMGISMYELHTQAEQTARLFPVIGRYIAEMRLSGGTGFNLAPTAQVGHWTVWGRPNQLVAAVADIYPV